MVNSRMVALGNICPVTGSVHEPVAIDNAPLIRIFFVGHEHAQVVPLLCKQCGAFYGKLADTADTTPTNSPSDDVE